MYIRREDLEHWLTVPEDNIGYLDQFYPIKCKENKSHFTLHRWVYCKKCGKYSQRIIDGDEILQMFENPNICTIDYPLYCKRCGNKEQYMGGDTFIVDTNMISIIKNLNQMGFTTKACCEGHLLDQVHQAYILFSKSVLDRFYDDFADVVQHNTRLWYVDSSQLVEGNPVIRCDYYKDMIDAFYPTFEDLKEELLENTRLKLIAKSKMLAIRDLMEAINSMKK